jgi:hypothetical protein
MLVGREWRRACLVYTYLVMRNDVDVLLFVATVLATCIAVQTIQTSISLCHCFGRGKSERDQATFFIP